MPKGLEFRRLLFRPPNENWVHKAEFPDGGADLRYLLTGVRTRVTVVREKPIHGPTLDLDIQIPHSAARQTATGPAARSSRLRLQVVHISILILGALRLAVSRSN